MAAPTRAELLSAYDVVRRRALELVALKARLGEAKSVYASVVTINDDGAVVWAHDQERPDDARRIFRVEVPWSEIESFQATKTALEQRITDRDTERAAREREQKLAQYELLKAELGL